MKKYIISVLASVGLAASAASLTTTVQPGTMTNLLVGFNGSAYVTQVILGANSTNASVLIYDTPTNNWTFVTSAYTNTLRYSTNYYTYYTNIYGATQYSYTNNALIDITNNLVPAATNNYPLRLAGATLAGTTTTYGFSTSGGAYFFDNGIWATNNGLGVDTITIIYR